MDSPDRLDLLANESNRRRVSTPWRRDEMSQDLRNALEETNTAVKKALRPRRGSSPSQVRQVVRKSKSRA